MVKLIKIKKTEELIAEYEEVESLWNVLCPFYKDRNLQQMTLTSPASLSKKFDISGELFWKQPLRGVVENGVLSQILEKYQ